MTKKQRESRIKELNSLLANHPASAELKLLQKEAAKEFKVAPLQCLSCRKNTPINEWTRLISYTTEFNYNRDAEYSDEFELLCPKCDTSNRFLSEKSKAEWAKPYKYFDFKAEKTYSTDWGSKPPYKNFVNR